ncbi:MAG TPA: hypothetical protein VK483_08810, partial [Chitinophagaceae bacterium]|nr:hypothetical protein [Chitinophagaceae bacterium]
MNRFFFIVCTICIFSQKINSANYYWVGGSGDWNDLNHWATSSGGVILHGQIPTALDDVFFDANSFNNPAQTVTLNVTEALCNNMDWTGVGNNPEFFGTALNTLKIYGSLTLAAVMKLNLFGPVSFEAVAPGKTITSLGQIFHYSSIVFNGVGGSWTLTDSLTLTAFGDINLKNGTLNSNNKKITAKSFSSTTATSRSLIMGSSIFNLLNGFTISATGMTVNAGSSTINLTDPNGCSFSGGGFVYNNLNLTGPGTINDNNSFNDVFFASDGTIEGNNIFNNVVFSNNGNINGNNLYNNLQFSPGYSYTLARGKTQTINTTFSANGNCGGHISIITDVSGSQSTINHPPGTVTVSFAILKDINAAGGATFTANNSIDLGNNSGWTINVQSTQDLFWVGNSGNWNDGNHWSTTSGGTPSGCCPTPTDNVFFDANSFSLAGQTVTINGAAFCNNISWTGTVNNPNFAATFSDYLKVYGSLIFIPGMTLGIQGNVYFEATTMGKTITSSGQIFGSVIFNGIDGGWTLQDPLKAMITISLNNGTLNTNNQLVAADGFRSTSSTTRTLTMGSSVFNLSGGSCWQVSTSGVITLTLNSGTSTINSTNLGGSSFSGDGLVYYNLNFTGPGNIGGNNTFNNVFFADNGIVYGNNIFNNATFLKNGNIHGNERYNNLIFTAGYTYTLENGFIQTINISLTANGTCASRITIASNLPGTQATISHPPGAVTVSYVSLKDLRATGGAIFTANNAIDLGNNSGWTINSVAPKDLYWIGNTGNWDDGNHWSLSSGGPPLGCLPTPVDNVFFDINSFTAAAQTVTINVEVAYCKSMTWTGAANNPALEGLPINSLKIYGSLTFISGMTQNFQGAVFFEATTTGKTITSAGRSFLNTVTLNGVGGGWTLQDSLRTTGIINFNNGILNTNNRTVYAGAFLSYSTTTRTLNMGSSIFNLSNIGMFWDINPTGITINAGTSVINNTNSGNASLTGLRSSGFNYYNLNFNNVSGIPGSIIGNNTFHDVFFVTDGLVENNNTFHDAVFSGNGTIKGNNTYHDLTFTPNYVYTLTSGKLQTIQNKWSIQGACNWYILLQSSIAGSPSFITKASGTVNAFNMHIQDIHCLGGATFNAYNCVDLGGNSGWNFLTLDPLSNPGPITGPVSVCSGQTGVVYYINSVRGAISYSWTVPPGAVITAGQGDTSIVVSFGATSGNVTVTAFNGCDFSNSSSNLAVAVNPILTPAITITASPGAIICTGNSATFTATASNTGVGTVNYNFKINGNTVQSGASNTYTSSSLVTGDAVSCVITITGGGTCLTSNTASSNTIIMTVMAYMTPAVSITVAPQNPICAGTSVTFTANATNTGSGSVNFNFKINGSTVQNGASNIYTSTGLINGDAVTCDITITGGNCLTINTASSNAISMTVLPSYTPAVSISASPSGSICAGVSVTFTATASNISGG